MKMECNVAIANKDSLYVYLAPRLYSMEMLDIDLFVGAKCVLKQSEAVATASPAQQQQQQLKSLMDGRC